MAIPLILNGRNLKEQSVYTQREHLRQELLVTSSTIIAFLGLLWGLIYLYNGAVTAGAIPILYAIFSFISISYYALTGRYHLFRFLQLLVTLIFPALLMIVLGGFIHSSGVILWSLTSPVGALLFDNRRKAAIWFLAFVVLVVMTGLMDLGVYGSLTQYLPQQGAISDQLLIVFFIMNIVGPSVVVFLLLVYFTRQRDLNYELLLAEQAKSDGLLLNILPQTIARRLKDGDMKIAECVSDASILFADVAGFTPLSTELGVEAVVDLLNDLHTGFDDIMEKHGLEKIRTIGDGYMAVSGLPTPRRDHAIVMADAALEMLDFVRRLELPGGRSMALRIGINSGTIMAGVIGRKKFSYDVWGDPVNVASRMESHGLSNCIQITEHTYELLRDDFVCVPRGLIEIKGKGQMETWFLVRRKAEQAPADEPLLLAETQ